MPRSLPGCNEGCEGGESLPFVDDQNRPILWKLSRVFCARRVVKKHEQAHLVQSTGSRRIPSYIKALRLSGRRRRASASGSNLGVVAFRVDVRTRDNYSYREFLGTVSRRHILRNVRRKQLIFHAFFDP